MGLTIAATFEKQGIYFAGDTLECHIRFTNECSTQGLAGAGHSRTTSDERALSRAVTGLPFMATGGPASNPTTGGSSRLASRKTTSRTIAQFGVSGNTAMHCRQSSGSSAMFPSLDDSSEHSGTPPLPPLINGIRRYSTAVGARDIASRPPGLPYRPDRGSSSGGDAKRTSRASERGDSPGAGSLQSQQYKRSGLAVFPSLDEGSAYPNNPTSRLDESRAYRGSSGAYDEQWLNQGDKSPAASRNQPSVQNGCDAGLTIQTTNIRHQSRPSTSSVLSTPTTSMSSWLPFGSKPQQQQQQLGLFSSRKPTCSTPNDGPPSETGSSGLLSSLWRNLAGGSNPPSRKGTRAGTLSEEDFGIERLAIGFVEASGSLALSTAYIKPDQLDLLMAHRGTDSTLGKGKRDPPLGGGLGGWAPANGAGHSSSRTQKSLPILISSPTVLFSELALAPGDSQTYSLKVQLPESLPPSFRGRAACITYDLVIVAKRSMLESSSYVARIPFRVLAHVGMSGSATTFSFERPIHMPPNSSRLTFQESTSVMTPRNASPSFIADADMSRASSASMSSPGGAGTHRLSSDGLDRLYEQLAGSEFLRSLLQGIDTNMLADTRSVPSIELGADAERAAVGAEASKANIQAICGRRAPVSFSLSQDERALASVWLPKRAYQLGDMVSGKVNLYGGSINVYHISIWLESVEAIGGQFASYEPGQTEALTRKIFAEHHGFCRGNSTLGFSLATSPSSASSFASAIVSNVWQLRIELIISAPGTPACDLVLSEVTPFPPAQSQLTSPSPYISRALSPPRRFLGQRIGRHQEGDDALAAPMKSPPPVMPMFAAAALHGSARAGRLRSSTMAGGSGSSPHQPHPPIIVSSPITETADLSRADHQQLPAALSPPRLRRTMDHTARATRRRYDLAREVQVQTLSCTVAIQMHPSLIRTHLDGQKDTYTIDLTKRSN